MQKKYYFVTILLAIIVIVLIGGYINQEKIPDSQEKEVTGLDATTNAQFYENQSKGASKMQSDGCPEGTLEHEGICKPKIMNLMAPQNIDYYLTGIVAHARIYELNDSNLAKKARELIKNIDDDYKKVEIIANWVRKSKNYGDCIGCDSLSKAFKSSTGVCNEAALITVAMLRSVGIPSIPVNAPSHVFTAFKIDNRWQGVDSTFCPDKNACFDTPIKKNFLTDNKEREINSVFYIVDNLGAFEQETGKFCDSFGYCTDGPFTTSRLLLQRNDLPTGKVIFPAVRKVASTSDGQISCALKLMNFKCDTTNGCYKDYEESKSESAAELDFWEKENWFKVYMNIDEFSIGYNLVSLPENNYTYRCIFQNDDPNNNRVVASKEFYVSPGSTTTITYNDLLIANATNEEFLELKTKIKSSTDDLGIYPSD